MQLKRVLCTLAWGIAAATLTVGLIGCTPQTTTSTTNNTTETETTAQDGDSTQGIKQTEDICTGHVDKR